MTILVRKNPFIFSYCVVTDLYKNLIQTAMPVKRRGKTAPKTIPEAIKILTKDPVVIDWDVISNGQVIDTTVHPVECFLKSLIEKGNFTLPVIFFLSLACPVNL